MAALVQTFPQQANTVTMLQTRPASASGMLQNTSQGNAVHPYATGAPQMHRNSYHGFQSTVGPTTYRGHTTMAPIAPYAFTSTPSLNPSRPQQGPFLRVDHRTASAPVIPTMNNVDSAQAGHRSRYPAAASISTSSSSSSDLSAMAHKAGSRDDSAIPSNQPWAGSQSQRPQSMVLSPTMAPKLSPPATSTKAAPDRYRRPGNRRADSGSHSVSTQSASGSAMPSGSGMASVSHLYVHPGQTSDTQNMSGYRGSSSQPSSPGVTTPHASNARSRALDDMILQRRPTRDDGASYRRRSIHNLDMGDYAQMYQKDLHPRGLNLQSLQQRAESTNIAKHPLRSSPVSRPGSSPEHTGKSYEDIIPRANHSAPASASNSKREPSVSTARTNPSRAVVDSTSKHDQPVLVNIPPRGSSTDATKRATSPSPLSKPMTMSSDSAVSKDSFASAVSAALQHPPKPTPSQATNDNRPQSPAARQLAALNDKDGKKSKTSRLRRAFSFGSAAELRKASAQSTGPVQTPQPSTPARLRKERYEDEDEAEQARIAQKQEEGGIGAGIYSGQGNFYSGSTDNLSISSTASSASIMLRKMGRGMKKSTRSLVGLFRPKSVVGVPAADGPITDLSEAQVSMVTVEAERDRVNVNANPHDKHGGGTGFPKLERNSLDTATSTASALAAVASNDGNSIAESSSSRKSVHGGERERAEVLAAVKKGILKRSGTDSGANSPTIRAVDMKTPLFNLPQIPHVNDSPVSSSPTTPSDDPQGHRRTDSIALNGEDYFMSALNFRHESKSMPATPQGTVKRSTSFSPRIIFHDTWPSGEYDRRGEIATCNRLTPMLAQQIKEELNTFKMEMEVHENSKIYTHFF